LRQLQSTYMSNVCTNVRAQAILYYRVVRLSYVVGSSVRPAKRKRYPVNILTTMYVRTGNVTVVVLHEEKSYLRLFRAEWISESVAVVAKGRAERKTFDGGRALRSVDDTVIIGPRRTAGGPPSQCRHESSRVAATLRKRLSRETAAAGHSTRPSDDRYGSLLRSVGP